MKVYSQILLVLLLFTSFKTSGSEIFLVDITKNSVFLFGDKDEFYIPIYEKPDENSNELSKIIFKTGVRDLGAEVMWPSVPKDRIHYNGFCGGQYFAYVLSDEIKNGFYKIKVNEFFYGWIKTLGFSLLKDRSSFPLGIYSEGGHDINFSKIQDSNIVYELHDSSSKNTTSKSVPISTFLASKPFSYFKIFCNPESETEIAKRIYKEPSKKIVEPIIVDFLIDQDTAQKKEIINEWMVYAGPNSESVVLGSLRLHKEQYPKLDFKPEGLNILRPFEVNFFPFASCGGESNYRMLHIAASREKDFVNLGHGPWGNSGWIKTFGYYGLFTDFPYPVSWLSELHSVLLRRDEKGRIIGRGKARFDEQFPSRARNNKIEFLINYDDLFDEKGKLDLELQCTTC